MIEQNKDSQNIKRPYFVYGTLKPTEIAHFQIEKFIKRCLPATLDNYALFVRDGAPVIFECNNWKVDGYLVWPYETKYSEFELQVNSYEGERLYSLQEIIVTCQSNKIECLTHIGKNQGKSHAEPLRELWSSKDDPIFSEAFPHLFAEIKKLISSESYDGPEISNWNYYNDITSKYLLLVTIIERLAFLYCGESFTTPEEKNGKVYYNDRIMKRITTLGRSEQFLHTYANLSGRGVLHHINVYDSRDANKSLSTKKPKEAMDAWYQVRSNLQHRGKSAYKDVKIVQDSLVSLANIMSDLLPRFIPALDTSSTFRSNNLAELIFIS